MAKLTEFPVGAYGHSRRECLGAGWHLITSGVTLDRYEIVRNEDTRAWEIFREGSVRPIARSQTLRQATAEVMRVDLLTGGLCHYNSAARRGATYVRNA